MTPLGPCARIEREKKRLIGKVKTKKSVCLEQEPVQPPDGHVRRDGHLPHALVLHCLPGRLPSLALTPHLGHFPTSRYLTTTTPPRYPHCINGAPCCQSVLC